MTAPAPSVKPARVHSARPAARDWPAWTDADTIELGPDPADDAWHADQSTDPHFDGPTPDDARDADGPEPDWDALAEDSANLDRLCAGCAF
jgi:hypothetical protein